MSNGLDNNLDKLQARKASCAAQGTIVNNLEQVLALDLTVDANRELAKTTAAAALTDAGNVDFSASVAGERDEFIARVQGVADSLS